MTVPVRSYIRTHQPIVPGEGREKRKPEDAGNAAARVNLFFQVRFAEGSI